MTPRVSFFIPSYNYGRYVGDCLSSILTQQGDHDFEILVIDDGSTDETQEILRAFSDPRVRVIRHAENVGHIPTINEGFSKVEGDLVLRIDADDRLRPDYLSSVLEKFRAFPDVGLVYGNVALIDVEGRVTTERVVQLEKIHGHKDFRGNEFFRLLADYTINTATAIARKKVWEEALPIPDWFTAFSDLYLILKIARRRDFYYINRVLGEVRGHSKNRHTLIVRDRATETAVFRLLDELFVAEEGRKGLETVKNKARAYWSLNFAEWYFGLEMDSDAKRCYLKALRYQPECGFRKGVAPHLFGTLVGRDSYEFFKSVAKSFRF